MKEDLQSFIYTEKLLAQMYRMAAPLTNMQNERNVLLAFSRDADLNASYFNHFYREEFGTNFDPMIPDGIVQGSYRDVLREIQSQELASYLEYRKQLYRQGNVDFRETVRFITDVKLGHILTIQALITELSTTSNQG